MVMRNINKDKLSIAKQNLHRIQITNCKRESLKWLIKQSTFKNPVNVNYMLEFIEIIRNKINSRCDIF